MYVTGDAKEFLEEGLLQDAWVYKIDIKAQSLEEKGNWKMGGWEELYSTEKNQGKTWVPWKINFGKMLW